MVILSSRVVGMSLDMENSSSYAWQKPVPSHYGIEEKVNRQPPGTGDYKHDMLWSSLMQDFSCSVLTKSIHIMQCVEKAAE